MDGWGCFVCSVKMDLCIFVCLFVCLQRISYFMERYVEITKVCIVSLESNIGVHCVIGVKHRCALCHWNQT